MDSQVLSMMMIVSVCVNQIDMPWQTAVNRYLIRAVIDVTMLNTAGEKETVLQKLKMKEVTLFEESKREEKSKSKGENFS